MTVEDAVRADLPKGFEDSPLAAIALELARQLDDRNSATSKSMVAKALVETLDKIKALAPPVIERDKIDDLQAKRAERRARNTAAKG